MAFTAKQTLFISWYVKLLNATRAAERAGYSGDRHGLEQQGFQLMRNIEIKAEIDRRIKESIVGPEELLSRVTSTAMADVTPHLNDAGQLDVQSLADAGLGHLVVGVKPGREGTEVTLANPQTARKMLARYHRLLGADVSTEVNVSVDPSSLEGLAAQIAAAATQAGEENDDTDRSGTEQE